MTKRIFFLLLSLISLHGAELNLKKRPAPEHDRLEESQAKRYNHTYLQLKTAVEEQDYAACRTALKKLNDPLSAHFLPVKIWDKTVIDALKSLPEYRVSIEPLLAQHYCTLLRICLTQVSDLVYDDIKDQFEPLLTYCTPDTYIDLPSITWAIEHDNCDVFKDIIHTLNLLDEELILLILPLLDQKMPQWGTIHQYLLDHDEDGFLYFFREIAHKGSLAFFKALCSRVPTDVFGGYEEHANDGYNQLSDELCNHNIKLLFEMLCQYEDVTDEESALKLAKIRYLIDEFETDCFIPLSGLCFLKNTKKQTGMDLLEPLATSCPIEIIKYLILKALLYEEPDYCNKLLQYLPITLEFQTACELLYIYLRDAPTEYRRRPFSLLEYLINQLVGHQLDLPKEELERFSSELIYHVAAYYPQSSLSSKVATIISQHTDLTTARYNALTTAIRSFCSSLPTIQRILSPDLYAIRDKDGNNFFHILTKQEAFGQEKEALEIAQYLLQTLPTMISVELLRSRNNAGFTPLEGRYALPLIIELFNPMLSTADNQPQLLLLLLPDIISQKSTLSLNAGLFANLDFLISQLIQAGTLPNLNSILDRIRTSMFHNKGTYFSWTSLRHNISLTESCTPSDIAEIKSALVKKMRWCQSKLATFDTMTDFMPVEQILKASMSLQNNASSCLEAACSSLNTFHATCKRFVLNMIKNGSYNELNQMQNMEQAKSYCFAPEDNFLSLFFTYQEMGDLLYEKRQYLNCHQLVQIVSKEYNLKKLTYGKNFSPLLPALFESNNPLLINYLIKTLEFRTQKDIDVLTGIASQEGSFRQLLNIAMHQQLTIPSLLCAAKIIKQKEQHRQIMSYINFDALPE